MDEKKVKNFIYKFINYDNRELTVSFPVSFPFKDSINELTHTITKATMDEIMEFLNENENMYPVLKQFINSGNQQFYDDRDGQLISATMNGEIDASEKYIRNLEKHFKNEVLLFADRIGPTDEEIFAESFHKLIHLPILPNILNREKSLAMIVSDTAKKMEMGLNILLTEQEHEIKRKLQELDVSATSEDINRLITQQCGKRELIQKQFQSELDAIRGHQKNEYRNWITSQIEESFLLSPIPTPVGNKSSMFVTQTPSMEESFTIHLGSQLKHMHNIRILSSNVTGLCNPLHDAETLNGMNIALSLYSSTLCGIVVLTPSGSVNANARIIKNANMSTEFHFDQIEDQIEKIEYDLKQTASTKNSPKFRAGDFFVTKHSNLSQSHIIFHLISDEPFQSPSEINSRHPVILGLRNVLKVASKHDVTMLTIPVLLRHEMSEEMTVPWCMRRAELVFKCAKGFMIESASWGGTELSTLQLLLPNNISEELFAILANMVPTVFRVANPKIFEVNK